MGLLDLYAAQAGPSAPAIIQPPSTPGERFSAEQGATTAPDRWFNLQGSRRDWYQKTVDELQTETGKSFANPLDPPTPEEMFKDGVAVPTVEIERNRHNALIEANRALREIKPDAINAEGIDTFIGVAGDAARQHAAELSGTGNGLAAFAGGALAPTPENILGLMIPPSRAVLGATTVARGFFGGVLREGAYQGAAMAALTAGTEGLDVVSRSETGTAPHLGEVLGNIAAGAAGGAILGAGFHALHMGPRALWERWTALPEDVRTKAPLEVKDAMATLQQEAIYSNANRLGLPWALHERYQGQALDAVMRGRAVTLGELRPGDMPMTALGTVLEGQKPGRIEVPREGVDLLPEKDIMSFVAGEAPKDWERLGAARGELAATEKQIEKIEGDAAWMVTPGKPDAATRKVLADLETQLEKTKSAERQAEIADKIEGIREGLTPATQRAKLMAEREELAAEVDALMRKFKGRSDEVAEGLIDLSGQVDRPRGKPANPDLATPTDLGKALEAAEFNRQIRMVRETGPSEFGQIRPESAKSGQFQPIERPELEAAAKAVLEEKGGALADFRKAVAKELEGLDIELADAKAAANCVNNGGGIP